MHESGMKATAYASSLLADSSDFSERDFEAGIHVLLAVRSEISRFGLYAMLDSLPFVDHVELCEPPSLTPRGLQEQACDVAIVSPALLTDATGLGTRAWGGAKIVLLLNSLQEYHAIDTDHLPVDGLLMEPDLTVHGLGDVLARTHKGEIPIPPSLARTLLDRPRRTDSARPARKYILTPREQQVLKLMVDGSSNKEIAKSLGISPHGAKRHVANLMAKMNYSNRTSAVALALREGVLPLP
jgi:two-component system, NarL family, nitrate/nitrite response regulator NarL